MQDILDLETRRTIYSVVKENPGLHLSKIAELVQMRTSHVEYHLHFLEKHEIIRSEKEKGYIRFYIRGQIGIKDKQYLFILRQKTTLEIILCLIKYGDMKHKDLLEHLSISASTLSYHLNKLVKKDIVLVHRFGEQKGYQIKDKDIILDVIMRYKPFNMYDGFNEIWSDLSV